MNKRSTKDIVPVSGEEVVIGQEPVWSSAISKDEYRKELARGLSWYAYTSGAKRLRESFEQWLKTVRKASAQEIAQWKSIPDKEIVVTFLALARMQLRGFPLTKSDEERAWSWFRSVVALRIDKKEVKGQPKKSVRDYVREAVAPTLSEIDAYVDDLVDGLKPKFLVRETFQPSYKGAHYKFIASFVERLLAETREALDARTNKKGDAQLREAYAYLPITRHRYLVKSLEEILEAVAETEAAYREEHPRKRRVKKRKVKTKKTKKRVQK